MTLPFKAVAVDMDGTFLDDNHEYDAKEFDRILTELERQNVQFIVASGRPYARLKEDFKGFTDRIDFVSVNGARLIAHDKEVGLTPMDKELVLQLIDYVTSRYPHVTTMVYGPKRAYLLASDPKEDKAFLSYFAKDTAEVASWQDLPDKEYVEITFNCSGKEAHAIETGFNNEHGQVISAFGSADFAVDVNAYGVSKATGLKEMLAKFGLTSDDLIAFGDGGNDVPMLKLAKYSYAMENGMPVAKETARFVAPKNTESGVFKVLQKYIDESK
ncbi:Cof-type HAD-IIB family hydrolase [Lactobacillus hominis]|uniref:Possible sugar-phosphatase n=1 Tax=Lactobacillus hominis DSM 23910 = CRBIP 24.179 TaxID=1423758 RepID=I7L9Z8_9LACO|nr:Cof-type HAD-IIB family hydrolase [Lactobacillus hominis]KRM85659.1 hypothetical protein FC41_GL000973 [Lactobacillus hominis DSM 23910 = CRBIP 24.179]MCT3347292.1 HAD family hydrolase [Lactobacillus hominis]CCI81819.1 Possible sugar-phosphatase [Lactobacillus hominis DSM 23910 = CRBIP 24.179]